MSRYVISPHPQNTPEWFRDRAGRVTGSRADCLAAKGRGGKESTTRRNYVAQLVTERLTGRSLDEGGYESPDMRRGKEREPHARLAYEAATGECLEEAGFAYLPNVPAGCSVDAFLDGRRGFVEAKCPNLANHIDYFLRGRVPPEYVAQITHDFWVTESEFVDFVSYNPDMPEGLQLLIVRAERSEFDIAAHEIAVFDFLKEVDVLERLLRERMPMKEAA